MAAITITIPDEQYDAILNSFCEKRGYGQGIVAKLGNLQTIKPAETKAEFVTKKLTEELTRDYKEKIKIEEHEKVKKIIDDRIEEIAVDIDVPEIKGVQSLEENIDIAPDNIIP